MAVILLAIGLILAISAIRNTTGALGAQVKQDLTASQGGISFLAWVAAIAIIGALGYVQALQTPSRLLLALIAAVVILQTKGGIFTRLVQELNAVPASPASAPAVPGNLPAIPVTSSGSSSSSGGAGGLGAVAGLAAVAAL